MILVPFCSIFEALSNGAKLIKTVGTEITELDKMRAFCVSMAAAITVIIASQLGLPVSSTHIAVGAIFGVGFLREYLKRTDAKRLEEIRAHHETLDPEKTEAFLKTFKNSIPLPSSPGNSLALISTFKLVMPKPHKTLMKCSTV